MNKKSGLKLAEFIHKREREEKRKGEEEREKLRGRDQRRTKLRKAGDAENKLLAADFSCMQHYVHEVQLYTRSHQHTHNKVFDSFRKKFDQAIGKILHANGFKCIQLDSSPQLLQ